MKGIGLDSFEFSMRLSCYNLILFRTMFGHSPIQRHFMPPLRNPSSQPASTSNPTPDAFESENYEALLTLAERLGKYHSYSA